MLESSKEVEFIHPIELFPSPPDLDCEKVSSRGESTKLAVDEDNEGDADHQDDAAFQFGYLIELLGSVVPGEKAEFRLPAPLRLPSTPPLGVVGCRASFNVVALAGGEFSSADRLARLFKRASVF